MGWEGAGVSRAEAARARDMLILAFSHKVVCWQDAG